MAKGKSTRAQRHSWRGRVAQSWLENVPLRARLSEGARRTYADFGYQRQRNSDGVDYVFSATVPVEGYEARRVRVTFRSWSPTTPIVVADGPDESPHRYVDGVDRSRLCLWYPEDPAEQRWLPEDGLLALFGMVTMHLFKEAWWRETGAWLGDEYPHTEDAKDPGAAA